MKPVDEWGLEEEESTRPHDLKALLEGLALDPEGVVRRLSECE